MKKFWTDSSSLGKLSILIGLFVIAPLIVLPWYPEDAKYSLSFLLPGGGSILLGILLSIFGKKDADTATDWRSAANDSGII